MFFFSCFWRFIHFSFYPFFLLFLKSENIVSSFNIKLFQVKSLYFLSNIFFIYAVVKLIESLMGFLFSKSIFLKYLYKVEWASLYPFSTNLSLISFTSKPLSSPRISSILFFRSSAQLDFLPDPFFQYMLLSLRVFWKYYRQFSFLRDLVVVFIQFTFSFLVSKILTS